MDYNLISGCCLVEGINGLVRFPLHSRCWWQSGDLRLLTSDTRNCSPTVTLGFSCAFLVRSMRVFFILLQIHYFLASRTERGVVASQYKPETCPLCMNTLNGQPVVTDTNFRKIRTLYRKINLNSNSNSCSYNFKRRGWRICNVRGCTPDSLRYESR